MSVPIFHGAAKTPKPVSTAMAIPPGSTGSTADPPAPVLGACILHFVMDAREKMNVGLGRTSLVVAASDGPGG
jgi:hypothetical protein